MEEKISRMQRIRAGKGLQSERVLRGKGHRREAKDVLKSQIGAGEPKDGIAARIGMLRRMRRAK
jgi:hypothetical protein